MFSSPSGTMRDYSTKSGWKPRVSACITAVWHHAPLGIHSKSSSWICSQFENVLGIKRSSPQSQVISTSCFHCLQ